MDDWQNPYWVRMTSKTGFSIAQPPVVHKLLYHIESRVQVDIRTKFKELTIFVDAGSCHMNFPP